MYSLRRRIVAFPVSNVDKRNSFDINNCSLNICLHKYMLLSVNVGVIRIKMHGPLFSSEHLE